MSRLTGTRRLTVATFLVAGLALTAAACGSSGSGSNTASVSGGYAAGDTGKAAPSAQPPRQAVGAATHDSLAVKGAGSSVQQRAVISTGRLSLTSSNLRLTRARVDAVLAKVGGHIGDENTSTDEHGTVTQSHLVVRVPSRHFDQAMRSLSGVATLRSSVRNADDVTTQVIDVQARIASERAGVRRLRHLVSRTANLSALLAVERALTERQGELQSLRQQRAYLADQTSLATITVDVTRRTTPSPVAKSAGGFVGGLQNGWDALVAVVVGFLVVLGAVLPFALAGTLLGVPLWLVVRRLRRARPPEAPVES